MRQILLVALIAAVLVAGCAAPAAVAPTAAPAETAATVAPAATATAAATPTEAPTAAPTATPTPVAEGVWLDPALPAAVQETVTAAIAAEDTVAPVASAAEAAVQISVGSVPEVARWFYAAVVPFPTLTDDVAWADVQAFWAGEAGALSAISRTGATPTLYLAEDTLAVLTALLGAPADAAPITVAPADQLVDLAWNARPLAWGIVPFDELEPRWKVLTLDGLDLLDKALDGTAYPLAVDIGAEGAAGAALQAALGAEVITNRHPDEMTVLVMTGVTALVRATAYEMEQQGVLYPAAQIGPVLAAADITHISNEIPFSTDCPYPDRNQEALVFCSSPAYIELLRYVGTDVVELTGNHFQDWGSQATLDTLDMYRAEGWPYYGGGADLADASKPIKIESNGNSFSFIGCNPVGPEYAWATEDAPGAAPCDFDYMHAQLNALQNEVDVPIATWQYWEFYFYEPTGQQQADFQGMVDAGAQIVSGSQAHHPQAIEFYDGAYIHYGLGNLFFDQMWSLETRQEMIDRHVIYQGRHISTELLTYMLENYAQPRPMTAAEREQLLTAIFGASGW